MKQKDFHMSNGYTLVVMEEWDGKYENRKELEHSIPLMATLTNNERKATISIEIRGTFINCSEIVKILDGLEHEISYNFGKMTKTYTRILAADIHLNIERSKKSRLNNKEM